MSNFSLLNKDLIFLNKEFANTDELFGFISDKGLELGFSKPSFEDALKTREQNFPTGLKLNEYSVAIPHADAEHIKEEFISLIILKSPITFKSMEDPKQSVEVNLVFVLGLINPDNQLETLQSVVELMQNTDKVRALLDAQSIEKIEEIIK